jgi:transposase, IS5 family
VEFGRKLWLDEVEGGLITRYEVLPGNASDAQQMKPSWRHHLLLFCKARGCWEEMMAQAVAA